jgi:tRNA-dihydrouridine synthase A
MCDESNKTSPDGTFLVESGDEASNVEDEPIHYDAQERQERRSTIDSIKSSNSNNHHNRDNKSFHIAPMINVTYREFRQLMRILSKRVVVWKEMLVDSTVVHTSDLDYYLEYERNNSHPIVCQLGGYEPELLYSATLKILSYGYDEVNLNMGCPSKLVADRNQFGAVLMKKVDQAELALKAMKEAVNKFGTTVMTTTEERSSLLSSTSSSLPKFSVKCRIGVDELDSVDDLIALIGRLRTHCTIFYLHARKAVLGGILSTVENRYIPPLNYPRVYDICRAFPDCEFFINGGISNLKLARDVCFGRPNGANDDGNSNEGRSHGVPCKICNIDNGSCIAPPSGIAPSNLRGCMLGRVARDNPCVLWDVDTYFYGEANNPCQNRKEVLTQYCTYLETIYPRRCCDIDPIVTKKIIDGSPYPDFQWDYCARCFEVRHVTATTPTNTPSDNIRSLSITVRPTNSPNNAAQQHRAGGIGDVKVTSYVMSRSIKPIMNIFYGLPMAKQFRREMEQLVRAIEYRNCGPASLIRRALMIIPIEVLEQPFVPAEDVDVVATGK